MKKSILLAFVPPSVRSPLLWMHFLNHKSHSKQYTLRVTVMRLTFIHRDTFLIRQVMREYLGSDEMLSANDRSYLLRLKNARSASRCSSNSSGRNSHAMPLTFACRVSSSVGPSHSRTALLPRCTFHSDFELFCFHVFSCYSAPCPGRRPSIQENRRARRTCMPRSFQTKGSHPS